MKTKNNQYKRKRKPEEEEEYFCKGNAIRIGDCYVQSDDEPIDLLLDRIIWLLSQESVLAYLDIIEKKKILPLGQGQTGIG